MCNLYNLTTARQAMRQTFGVTDDRLADLPAQLELDVYPDRLAPVVRAEGGGRVAEPMRWGFPPPPKAGSRPVTNVRNLNSSYWRHWLNAPDQRCLVPVSRFCEYEGPAGAKRKRWFDLPAAPLFAFAGIWRPWRGERGRVEGEHLLFSFLTCEPNELVAPIHARAMPVLLAHEEDWDIWLTAPWEVAQRLVAPFAAEAMAVE